MRYAIAASLVFFAGSTPGLAAANLECMNSGYSAAEQKVIDDETANVSAQKVDSKSRDALMSIFSAHAGECADKNGWGPEAIFQATLYRTAGSLREGLERNAILTSAQMARVKATVAKADQARLRAVLAPVLEAAFSGGKAPEPSERDIVYLGTVIMGAGIPLGPEQSTFVGKWIGASMFQQICAEKFSHL